MGLRLRLAAARLGSVNPILYQLPPGVEHWLRADRLDRLGSRAREFAFRADCLGGPVTFRQPAPFFEGHSVRRTTGPSPSARVDQGRQLPRLPTLLPTQSAFALLATRIGTLVRLFDPETTPNAIKRYVVRHRAKKGSVKAFLLDQLREADAPLTSFELTNRWLTARGLRVDEQTQIVMRKRIGAALITSRRTGVLRNEGVYDGLKGWVVA
jgi:hypothetical protein